jgi:hypothetical protein
MGPAQYPAVAVGGRLNVASVVLIRGRRSVIQASDIENARLLLAATTTLPVVKRLLFSEVSVTRPAILTPLLLAAAATLPMVNSLHFSAVE